MNHRYHAKRCLYLCVIKKCLLSSSSSVEKVEWSTFQNEARKPVLVVFPCRCAFELFLAKRESFFLNIDNVFAAKKLDEFPGFSVRIIPSATSLFNVAKLSMSRNNVRSVSAGTPFVSTFKNVEASFLLIILIFFFCDVEDGVSQPTPTYNSSILEDMFLEDNSELLKKAFSGWKELGDALILLKVCKKLTCIV